MAAAASTVALTAGGLTGLGVVVATSAVASPGPVQQRSALGVTADALPTAQINGIVWSVAVHGNTAYAAGRFTKARPAGAALGTHEVTRNNFLSFSVTTGVLNASFTPSLNGQALITTVSPDGSTVYVGGDFTSANGQPRSHIAAYDTASGALLPFAPKVNGEVRGIALSPDGKTVFLGGGFGSVAGNPRSRLAAVSAGSGALLAWKASADARVNTLTVTPDGSRLIVGGIFYNLDGQGVAGGLGAVSAINGSFLQWKAAHIIRDAGGPAGILHVEMSSDNQWVVGNGFSFHGGGNLEGVFLADPTTGAIHWLEDCHGDSYGSTEVNGIVYVVSHEHFCANVGTFPDTVPRTAWYRSTAFTEATTGTLNHNSEAGYKDWFGMPSPSQINWYPYLATGNFSGAHQAAWSVAANSQYVVEGGEFPSVNGTKQEGLVRFGVPAVAPNRQGPRVSAANFHVILKPSGSSAMQVSVRGVSDRDDLMLTYTFTRVGGGAVHTVTVACPFWNLPTISFLDTGLSPGHRYQYTVRVSDGHNSVTSGAASATTAAAATPDPNGADAPTIPTSTPTPDPGA